MPTAQQDWTPNLVLARETLRSLLASIDSFPQTAFLFRAPVIDHKNPDAWKQDEVLGLKRLIQSIEDLGSSLDEIAKSNVAVSEDPLPNALGFVTLWKQVLLARPPLAGIRIPLSAASGPQLKGTDRKGKGKVKDGYIDIISGGGKEWIKLYTKKQSQLLAEFREHDSYINSDYEDDDSDTSTSPVAASSSQFKLPKNSLTDMADALLDLARTTEKIPGAPVSSLSVRITRIPETEDGHQDDRISQVFNDLRARWVSLSFGDLSKTSLEDVHCLALDAFGRRTKALDELRPALRINLDPTALMGLCSDILHHPLPSTMAEAKERFFRPDHALRAQEKRKSKHGETNGDHENDDMKQSQNSRELVRNVLEEMDHPLIDELRERLQAASDHHTAVNGGTAPDIQFWATEEAITHAQEALGSEELVGEGMEQRRMRRLLGIEGGDFFEGSRYEGKEGILRGLRVRPFDQEDPGTASTECSTWGDGAGSFHRSLHHITSAFLDDYNTYTSTGDSGPLANFLKPNRLPVPKVATLSLPFPIVSLISLSRGAKEGMTTLMMGNIVLRDVFGQHRWRVRGWVQGDYETQGEGLPEVDKAGTRDLVGEAVVWMMPYRSLGEGKRVKFARGDYSYPER